MNYQKAVKLLIEFCRFLSRFLLFELLVMILALLHLDYLLNFLGFIFIFLFKIISGIQ